MQACRTYIGENWILQNINSAFPREQKMIHDSKNRNQKVIIDHHTRNETNRITKRKHTTSSAAGDRLCKYRAGADLNYTRSYADKKKNPQNIIILSH